MHPFLGALAGTFSVNRQTAANTSASNVTTTTSGTAYNNITPVELIASTAADAYSLTIRCSSGTASTGARTSTVFEVMAGGSGSEYTIIGPVACGHQTGPTSWTFPIYIPGGTRLSIRVRSARVTAALTWTHHLIYGGNSRDGVGLPQRWIAYGLSDDASANAQGTIVTPGNGAWGSWTAITTSTTYAHDLWLPIVDGGSASTMTSITTRVRWAIASTTDAATMATNSTVWQGSWVSTSTAEAMSEAFLSTSTAGRVIGVGTNGIIYAPTPAGASVSASALASAAPDSNALGCSILAAL